MLTRSHRLPPHVRLSKGKTLRFPLLVIKYQITTLPHSRASVVVSKRVSPKAVTRNRIKRVVHAALSFPDRSYDMLIIVQPQASKIENDMFTTQCREIFSTLHLE